jgi:NAD+-processing family protein with receiver domain
MILEDNLDRLERFTAAVRAIDTKLEMRSWRSARQMLQEVEPFLPSAHLISLDHDLDRWEGDLEDPGDGLEVVKVLVMQSQICPVIIHTSNRERSDWMAGEFELAGWKYHRVAPIGEDWIEEHWAKVARKLLRRPGSARSKT